MTCCHPIHSGSNYPSRHFRNAFCEYERNDMKAAIKRTLSFFRKGSVVTQPLRNDLGKLVIGGNQVVPFGEMLVHRLRGGGPDRVGVLPNLRGDIEQRDHDRESADDLSEIGEVVEIHVSQLVVVGQALRLPKSKIGNRSVAYDFSWRSVLGGVEVAFRFCD